MTAAPVTDRTLQPHSLDAVLDHLAARIDPGTSASETVWATIGDRRVVVKAGAGRARAELRREAESLSRIDAPGLVELLGLHERDTITALVVADAGHRTLQHPTDAEPDTLLRALQHTCRVVQALHRAGWSHGRLAPEHVIVGPRGRVRLCSLGAARPAADRPDGVAEDLDRLVDLVRHVADELDLAGGHPRFARQLRRIVDDLDDRAGPPDPITLAERMTSLGGRRSTRSSVPARAAGWLTRMRVPALRAGSRSRTLAILGGLCAAVALGFGVTSIPLSRAAGTDRTTGEGTDAVVPLAEQPEATTTTVEPPEEVGPPPTVLLDGSRYRVGLPGDLAVTGDWDCDGRVTVRLLRPGTGELFDFAPSGTDAASRQGVVSGVVEGARRLDVDRSESPGTCDRTVVVRADGTEQVVP